MKRRVLQISLAFLLIALPASSQVTVSVDSPNDGACGGPLCNVPTTGGGTGSIRVVLAGGSNVDASLTLTSTETGQSVAAEGYNGICSDAIMNNGFTTQPGSFKNVVPCSGIGGGTGCCNLATGDSGRVILKNAALTRGFRMQRFPFRFTVSRDPTQIRGIRVRSNAGNTFKHDILDQWVARVDVDPDNNGRVEGLIRFSVTHDQGGTNPQTFSFSTVGLSDAQIHNALCNGIEGLSLSKKLKCIVHNGSQLLDHAEDPEAFGNGTFVQVPNLGKKQVTEMSLTGAQDQAIIQEQNVASAFGVPSVNSWGIALLLLIPILSTAWYMRRRKQLQPG